MPARFVWVALASEYTDDHTRFRGFERRGVAIELQKPSMSWNRTFLYAGLLVLLVGRVDAHHSGAMFDRAKTVTLQGTVKEFLFTNPHCWVRLLVPEKGGKVIEWDIEASAPTRLVKWGIS